MTSYEAPRRHLPLEEGVAKPCIICQRFGFSGLPNGFSYNERILRNAVAIGQPSAPTFEAFAEKEDARRLGFLKTLSDPELPQQQRKILSDIGLDPSRIPSQFGRCSPTPPNDSKPSLISAQDAWPQWVHRAERAELALLKHRHEGVRFFSVSHTNWCIPAQKLLDTNLHELRAQFEVDVVAATTRRGFLLASLHGHFDAVAKNYRLTFLGVGSDAKVRSLSALRSKQYGYTPDAQNGQPLISIGPRTSHTHEVRAVMDLDWIAESVREVGDPRLSTLSEVLPDPYGALSLVWLSRYRLEDLHITIGCRFLECGHFQTVLGPLA